MPVRRRRRRGARHPARARRRRLARRAPRRAARPALRLPGPRPVGARAGPALQPGQAPARPLRQGHRGRHPLGRGRLRPPLGRARPAQRHRLRALRAPQRRHQPVLRLGRRPGPAHAVGRHDHLRDPRPGRHRAPPRRARGAAGHLRRHRRTRPSSPTSSTSASPPWSCCPSTSSCTTPASCEQGLTNYWGYNSIGFLAAHNDYASRGQAGEQVQEFRQMVRELHAPASR